jgi:hypothetical protein
VRRATGDDALAAAVSDVATRWDELDDAGRSTRLKYLGAALRFLLGSRDVERAQLLRGLKGIEEAPPDADADDRAARLRRILELLMEKGIGDADPDVLLLYGAVTGDEDAFRRGCEANGNPNVSDYELVRRYRDVVCEEHADLYRAFMNG